MMVLEVTGMTCGHCRDSVTRAVQGVDPQATVRVDLADGRVELATDRADPKAFIAAIEAAGYGARDVTLGVAPPDAPHAPDAPDAPTTKPEDNRTRRCCCG